jgi:hypothetical protein
MGRRGTLATDKPCLRLPISISLSHITSRNLR